MVAILLVGTVLTWLTKEVLHRQNAKDNDQKQSENLLIVKNETNPMDCEMEEQSTK